MFLPYIQGPSSAKQMKKKNEEYKRTHIKMLSLKLKYFLKTVLATPGEFNQDGTSIKMKKTIQSNGIKTFTNKLLKLILPFWQPT